jgi:hypothetical protein
MLKLDLKKKTFNPLICGKTLFSQLVYDHTFSLVFALSGQ